MKEKIIIFNNLESLGVFIGEQRVKKKLELNNVAEALLIKKSILIKFEKGDVSTDDLKTQPHLGGFLNSYIRYLKLEKECKLELTTTNTISNLKKSNLQLETSESKKNNYSSVVILLSLIMIGLTYLIWNKETYLNLYLLGTTINQWITLEQI